jgi:hypothetical protein
MPHEELSTYGTRFRRAYLALEILPALGVLAWVWFLTRTTYVDLAAALFAYGLYRFPLVYGETSVGLETDRSPEEVRVDCFEGWEPLNGLVRGMAREVRPIEYGTAYLGSTWGNRWRIEQEFFERSDGGIEVYNYGDDGNRNAYVVTVIPRGGTTRVRYDGLTTDGRASVAGLLRNAVEFHYSKRAAEAQGYRVVDVKNRFSLRQRFGADGPRNRNPT